MKIWVGDETGLVKGVQVESKKTTEKWRKQDRALEIQRMCWGPGDTAQEREHQLFLGLKNGSVVACEARTGNSVREFTDFGAELVGLDVLHTGTMATCTTKGLVQYRPLHAEEPVVSYEKAHGDETYCMRTCPGNSSLYALGGSGSGKDLKVFDISRPDPVFKAKNVSNDMLDLQVPVWIRDLAFVPNSDGTKIVTVSAHRHVRLYDTKVKKKPIFSEEFGDHPIMSVDVTPDGRYAVFGNSIGEMRKFDLRNGKVAGGFKGPAGSVRSIQCHPTLPYVASCGLDRHVYVHKVDGPLVAKVYLKQRCNAVLFSAEGPVAVKKEDSRETAEGTGDENGEGEENKDHASEGDDEGDEDVWDTMEVVQDSASKRKAAAKASKKQTSAGAAPKKKAKKSA